MAWVCDLGGCCLGGVAWVVWRGWCGVGGGCHCRV